MKGILIRGMLILAASRFAGEGMAANGPSEQFQKGLAECAAGRWPMAIAPFENALRADPFKGDPTIYRKLAEAYMHQSRTADVVRTADRGLAVHARDPWLLEWKAQALLRLRKPDDFRDIGHDAERALWKKPPTAGKTLLHPPFAGTWKVREGNGDGLHAGLGGRFAWDFAKVDEAGAEQDTKARDRRQNATYFGWDQPVLAPADGEIVAVEQAYPDNVLVGVTNERMPLGNLVVIKHAADEYTVLAHLKKGSVGVKPGDTVMGGQEIGRVGNSGSSPSPQLHLSLLSQWDPALGLPVLLAGTTPKKGDLVRGGDFTRKPVALIPATVAATLVTPVVASTTLDSPGRGAAVTAPVVAAKPKPEPEPAREPEKPKVVEKEKEKKKDKEKDKDSGGGGSILGALGAAVGVAAAGAGAAAVVAKPPVVVPPVPVPVPAVGAPAAPLTPTDPAVPSTDPATTEAGQPGEGNPNAAQEGQQPGQQGEPGTEAPSQNANHQPGQQGNPNAAQEGLEAGQQGAPGTSTPSPNAAQNALEQVGKKAATRGAH